MNLIKAFFLWVRFGEEEQLNLNLNLNLNWNLDFIPTAFGPQSISLPSISHYVKALPIFYISHGPIIHFFFLFKRFCMGILFHSVEKLI